MQPMKCLSCREDMRLAIVNRHLKPDRVLLFCPSCARLFMQPHSWSEVEGMPWSSGQHIQCLGCDRKISHVFINMALHTRIGFCHTCHGKLVRQHLWEECRRVGDDGFIYTPDTIQL